MKNKQRFFCINGYWKDNKSTFHNYLVTDLEWDEENEDLDDKIFFYGLSEQILKELVWAKENTKLEFVVTDFKETFL